MKELTIEYVILGEMKNPDVMILQWCCIKAKAAIHLDAKIYPDVLLLWQTGLQWAFF